MLYVAVMKALPGTAAARTARRMTWQVPQVGGEVIGEYWLQTPDPACIAIFKVENIGQMWAVFNDWNDLFEISIYPAVSAEEGLKLLKQMS